MDVNYLLAREQISLMRAAETVSIEARHAHLGMARGYAAALVEHGFPNQNASAADAV